MQLFNKATAFSKIIFDEPRTKDDFWVSDSTQRKEVMASTTLWKEPI